MASYLELQSLFSDSDLQDRVAVAAVKKAQTLLDGGAPTANEVAWASGALQSPRETGLKLLKYVLAKNSGADVTTIQGATDATIQANVDTAADVLIAGGIT